MREKQKNIKYLRLFGGKFVVSEKVANLHPVWNRYQKQNTKADRNVKICQITGKERIGNNVSHSKRTKRSFDVNLFSKKFFYVEENCWITSTSAQRVCVLLTSMGLDAAIKQAVSKKAIVTE